MDTYVTLSILLILSIFCVVKLLKAYFSHEKTEAQGRHEEVT